MNLFETTSQTVLLEKGIFSLRKYAMLVTDFPSYLAVVLTLQQQTASRRVIYSMLDIENVRRPIAPEILDSRWLQETKTCTAAGS